MKNQIQAINTDEKLRHAHQVMRYNIMLRQAISEQPKPIQDTILARVKDLAERLEVL